MSTQPARPVLPDERGRAENLRELAIYANALARSARVLRRQLHGEEWHAAAERAHRVELDLRDLRDMLDDELRRLVDRLARDAET